MTEYKSGGEEYSMDASSGSPDEVEVQVDRERNKSIIQNSGSHGFPMIPHAVVSNVQSLNMTTPQVQSLFGIDFQAILLCALLESTPGLIGPAAALLSHAAGTLSGSLLLPAEGLQPPSTWTETAYNKAEARRNKLVNTMSTSAGEGSDSQAEFPIPENENMKEKSVRTRRLSRSRLKRAHELTSTRKAAKKKPYVIHVDGTCKGRGIH